MYHRYVGKKSIVDAYSWDKNTPLNVSVESLQTSSTVKGGTRYGFPIFQSVPLLDSAEPVVTVLCQSLLPCGWELYGMRGREGKGRETREEGNTMHTQHVVFQEEGKEAETGAWSLMLWTSEASLNNLLSRTLTRRRLWKGEAECWLRNGLRVKQMFVLNVFLPYLHHTKPK